MARSPIALLPLLLLGCAALAPAPPPLDPAPERPNIVLIIGDAVGYRDFGFMGSKVAKTPNLDRLAAGGTVFPLGFSTASVSRPAQRSLLTGLDPMLYETREKVKRGRMDAREEKSHPVGISLLPTLPKMLLKRGYASFMAGRYWEGSPDLAGFSDGTVAIAGARRLVRITSEPAYEFIDAHVDEPFFLWFAPQLPYLPFDAPERFRALYADSELPPGSEGYFANLSWLDEGIGELVAYIEAKGLRERTLFVYVSAGGWQAEGFDAGDSLDGPKGSGSLYELGVRTPLVFNAPGWVPAGQERTALVSTVDVVPTLLAYAGVAPRKDLPGRSLRPEIEGEPGDPPRWVAGHMRGVRWPNARARMLTGKATRSGFFARSPKWYYIEYERGGSELFDMESDPAQDHDVSAANPEEVVNFRRRLRKWEVQARDGELKVIYQRPARGRRRPSSGGN